MKKFEYDFPRPSIATDIAIFTIKNDVLSIVLIERKEEPFGWALPGGFLRPDENLEDCARRETEEETGGTLQELVYVNNFFMAPGSSSELCHLLCGQIDATNIGGIHGNVDEGEDIRVFSEPATAAFKRVQRGEIASAFSIIGLQWLELNREALRRRWT